MSKKGKKGSICGETNLTRSAWTVEGSQRDSGTAGKRDTKTESEFPGARDVRGALKLMAGLHVDNTRWDIHSEAADAGDCVAEVGHVDGPKAAFIDASEAFLYRISWIENDHQSLKVLCREPGELSAPEKFEPRRIRACEEVEHDIYRPWEHNDETFLLRNEAREDNRTFLAEVRCCQSWIENDHQSLKVLCREPGELSAPEKFEPRRIRACEEVEHDIYRPWEHNDETFLLRNEAREDNRTFLAPFSPAPPPLERSYRESLT
ncbi:hypothetical protein FPV67DRAFT_1451085 [Lyophyllum atratum]|nr:hypothetical protein FPV67DRAFT_1451085 [Lyophyllum atratum]